jgi:ribosome modulation factor
MPTDAMPVWAQGYVARLSGLNRARNPYLNGTDARQDQWDDGWLFADAEIVRGTIDNGNRK